MPLPGKTEPAYVALAKGENVLTVSRGGNNIHGLSIRDFALIPVDKASQQAITGVARPADKLLCPYGRLIPLIKAKDIETKVAGNFRSCGSATQGLVRY